MTRFSANLGFLWNELALPDAIRAAKAAGFDAVECHWPFETPPYEIKTALADTEMKMLGLNTLRGDLNGLSAVPNREDEARDYVDQALSYANEIDCFSVHVMAGFTDQSADAERVFVQNLRYACDKAQLNQTTILIEPLNHFDAPNYHLNSIDGALRTIDAVERDNLKIMFDCYHIQIMQGDLRRRLASCIEHIGHIQFAGVPDRSEPVTGEVNYPWLLREIEDMGWDRPFGAEYKPKTTTQAGLDWMKDYRD